MKGVWSRIYQPIYATDVDLKPGWSSGPGLVLAGLPVFVPPGQAGPDPVRLFLMVIMVLIVLLFVAVAVILPLSLHFASRRQKQRASVPAGGPVDAVDQETIPTPRSGPSPVGESEASPEAPASATYSPDLAKTQPSLLPRKEQLAETGPAITVGIPSTRPVSGQRPAHITWQIAGLTDVGLRRELNEDNLLMAETELAGAAPIGLYIVADGLGGHEAGEIASQLTIDTIQQHFMQQPPTTMSQAMDDWLKAATLAANQTVLAQQGDRTDERKMGSTLIMALVAGGQAHIVNVGDSRAYRLTSTVIQQISVDHSLVERLIQIGQLTREEARTHRQKNVIYSTIGDKDDLEIGLYQVALQPGDRLLLCSDGLSGMITDEEILEISRSRPDPAAACRALVEAAKQAGGSDNITAILVHMNGG